MSHFQLAEEVGRVARRHRRLILASLGFGAVREFYGRHSPEQNLSQKWDKFSSAEEVGLEPTSGFLHRDGLAIHWNSHYPTPPSILILTIKIIKVNLKKG